MGIKNLKHLLLHTCKKGVYHYDNVNVFLKSELRNKSDNRYVIGIDANLFMMRYKKLFDNVESGILKQVLITINAGMLPVYIFDGRAPDEKKKKINQRKNRVAIKKEELSELLCEYNNYDDNVTVIFDDETNYQEDWDILEQRINLLKKQSVYVNSDDIINVKNLLDILKIPYYTASGEADDLLTLMYKNKFIDACLTDDTDMLPKGCGNMIQINKDGVTQFILEDILDYYGFNMKEFIDLCILLGPDYHLSYIFKYNNLSNCKSESVFYKPTLSKDEFVYKSSTRALCILELFNKTRSIDEFIKIHSIDDPKIIEYLDEYINCRKLFNINNEISEKFSYKLKPFVYNDIEKYIKYDMKKQYRSMIIRANRQIINLFN